MKIMNSLKVKRMDIIVASDLVSRGIDIETIDMVINFDIPQTPEIYLHRIGRTGRFGKIGVAFSLINSSEIVKESDKEFYDQIKEFDYS
jgi:superfamily II DNA/RNA helicase